MTFYDRRRRERHVMAGLVMVIFILLASFVVVLTAALDVTRDVKALVEATQADAERSVAIAADTRRLVDEGKPCNPGDPPDSLGCQRERENESFAQKAIDALLRALAGAIEAHDLNAHRQHQDLRQRMPPTTAPSPTRTPITVPPVTLAPPTPPTSAPTTTTPTTTTTRPVPLPSLVPTLPPPAPVTPRTIVTTTTTTTPPPPPRPDRGRPNPPPAMPVPTTCDTLPNGRCHPGRG